MNCVRIKQKKGAKAAAAAEGEAAAVSALHVQRRDTLVYTKTCEWCSCVQAKQFQYNVQNNNNAMNVKIKLLWLLVKISPKHQCCMVYRY